MGFPCKWIPIIRVSHLQFVEDTLLLDEKNWGNIQKSLLVDVNVGKSWLLEAAMEFLTVK